MKEYIDRELLLIGVDGCIFSLHAQAKGDPIRESAIKLVEATRGYIASLSAADVAEVVRCRECKHFNLITHECENELLSTDHEGGASYSLNFYDDDFCSYGELRETSHD